MTTGFDNDKMSGLIREAADEIIDRTGICVGGLTPVTASDPEVRDGSVVYLMVNGLKYAMDRGQYEAMEKKNRDTLDTMNAQIKELISDFKSELVQENSLR